MNHGKNRKKKNREDIKEFQLKIRKSGRKKVRYKMERPSLRAITGDYFNEGGTHSEGRCGSSKGNGTAGNTEMRRHVLLLVLPVGGLDVVGCRMGGDLNTVGRWASGSLDVGGRRRSGHSLSDGTPLHLSLQADLVLCHEVTRKGMPSLGGSGGNLHTMWGLGGGS